MNVLQRGLAAIALAGFVIVGAGCRDAATDAPVVATTQAPTVAVSTPSEPTEPTATQPASTEPSEAETTETPSPEPTPEESTTEAPPEPTTLPTSSEPSTSPEPTVTPDTSRPSVQPTSARPSSTAVKTTAKPTVTKPAVKQQLPYAKPSFPILGFATYTGKERNAFLDFTTEATPAQIKAAKVFNESRVPKNNCGVVDPTGTPAQIEKMSTAYANCLLATWAPVVKALGVAPLPKTQVIDCSIHLRLPQCKYFDVDKAMAVAYEGKIYLSPVGYVRETTDFTIVLAHETMHVIQFALTLPNEPNLLIMKVGAYDLTPGDQLTRRLETQAQCLAFATVQAGGMSYKTVAGSGQVVGSDERHWGWKSIAFWLKQSAKGSVGECNTYIAANSLLTWD